MGFVIVLGEVKRVGHINPHVNNARPRYRLFSREAWRLEQNQSRVSIDLGELGSPSPLSPLKKPSYHTASQIESFCHKAVI